LKQDYHVDIITNHNGEFCGTYPLDLYVLAGDRTSPDANLSAITRVNDASVLKELFWLARFSRVRTRFPMPVILFNGKNICRSSTLSQKLEMMLQTTTNSIKDRNTKVSVVDSFYTTKPNEVPEASPKTPRTQARDFEDKSTMGRCRAFDVELLQQLGVSHICDLMVENAKKKYGVAVCSSEKNDSHGRYEAFKVSAIPYPGVEFFRDFNAKDPASALKLRFDWHQISDPANLRLDERFEKLVMADWENYKLWDLVTLTKNYLLFMLHILCDNASGGLLVHCISGWDRTPMFVSLLRLSLWADGEVHKSLSAKEMLYLTIGYDWLLFRHQLVDRQSRKEDIFFFCFFILGYIKTQDFSVHTIRKRLNNQNGVRATPADKGVTIKSKRHKRQRSIDDINLSYSHENEDLLADDFDDISEERVIVQDDEASCGSWQLMTNHLEEYAKGRGLAQEPMFGRKESPRGGSAARFSGNFALSPKTMTYNYILDNDNNNILHIDDLDSSLDLEDDFNQLLKSRPVTQEQIEEAMQRDRERERARRLEELKQEFLKHHASSILPETEKLTKGSIWDWFR
jgi:myotubularin-related protein 14